MAVKKGIKPVIENRKARHDYFIEESYECGIELKGTEVKSLRQGKGNLKESFAHVKNNEVFVEGMHISPYDHGNIFNVNPLRVRRLLLHRIRSPERIYQLRIVFSIRSAADWIPCSPASFPASFFAFFA